MPVAVSLSGGLDSSAVTALLADSGAHVRTYSLGFADEDDELPLARALADRWGTEQHEAVVDADELLDDLLQMVWALDEPYGGGLPSWYVYRFMADDVKVGLTGTGGDELFGNYRRFVPFERARLRALRAATCAATTSSRRTTSPRRETRARPRRAGHRRVPAARVRRERERERTGLRALPRRLDAAARRVPARDRPLLDGVVARSRTPFLDHELVEYVASIAPERRTDADDPKRVLREAVADLLTPAHLQAPKQGFVFPLARWLRGPLRPLAERLLSAEHLRAQGIFRPDADFLGSRRRAPLAGADVPALAPALRRGRAQRGADVRLARRRGARVSYAPHDVEWTPEKVARVWDFYGSVDAFRPLYFSAHSGAAIVGRADREVGLRGKRVLDFGAGHGDLLAHLFARGIAAKGLEFSSGPPWRRVRASATSRSSAGSRSRTSCPRRSPRARSTSSSSSRSSSTCSSISSGRRYARSSGYSRPAATS